MIEFFKTLLRLTQPYRFRLVLGVIFGVLAGVAEPLMIVTVVVVYAFIFPADNQENVIKVLDEVRKYAPAGIYDPIEAWRKSGAASASRIGLILIVSAVPLVFMFRNVITYLYTYLMNWVTVRAISDLRQRVFEHLVKMPLGFFSKNSTGELMSRVNDVGVLQNVIANTLITIIKDPVTVVVVLTKLLLQDTRFTLVTLIVFPLCLAPVIIYSRKVRKSSAAIQTHNAELSKTMHETFTGNRIIKAYNLEDILIGDFRQVIRRYIGHYMRVVRSLEIPGVLIEVVGAIAVAILLFYVASQRTSPANFLLFIGMIFTMYKPLKNVARLHAQFEQARAASGRVFELLAMRSTLAEPASPRPLVAAGQDIHFENITFGYEERDILKGVDLRIRAGQMVALVGASGSGKTTLTNLLLRFYDPKKGKVTIGGVDLRDVTTRDLRNQIAVVTQETILFDDTIRRNIELGRPGATSSEIEDAARHAMAHDFIMQQGGYDKVVGEKGVNLSGGQKQRIAIARAILRNAPILVLDEATNSLDTESERAVQQALDKLMEGRTALVIAHRLSTVQHADLIVVMDQGRIVEMETHDELLRRGGFYQKLHSLQFQA